MVVTALQRFGSRSVSFNHQSPRSRPTVGHFRNMSADSVPQVKSEPLLPEAAPASLASADALDHHDALLTPGAFDGDSSTPSSPNMLPRNASFSGNSGSFQEDWEAFPPLDRITVFDLLDNFALPRQLEKWQATLAQQREKVRRQRDKFKSSSINARERVVEEWRRRLPTAEEQLDKYRKRMRASVDRLNTRWNDTVAVTAREKVSFIAGVLNIFISGYLIGALPQYFYLWYTAQVLYFMPIRAYTYHKRGYHYFLADLCYFVNALLLLSIWVFPQSKRLFISMYCLAYGNNAVAIAMWRNSLVFHSLDKTTSLFIHIMPPVTIHCLVHLTSPELQAERFPAIYAISTSDPMSPEHYSLWAMMFWATIPYAVWQLSYHFFITVRRAEKIAAGRPTSFTWLRRSYAKNFLGRFVLSLPNKLQEPAFMLIQYFYAILTMLPCPLWFWYRWASATFLVVVFGWSIYNGATYYIDVFGKRFQKELELLKKDVAKWQSSPSTATEDGGLRTPQPLPPGATEFDQIPLLDGDKVVAASGSDSGASELMRERKLIPESALVDATGLHVASSMN